MRLELDAGLYRRDELAEMAGLWEAVGCLHASPAGCYRRYVERGLADLWTWLALEADPDVF